jgi:hypothetical protein
MAYPVRASRGFPARGPHRPLGHERGELGWQPLPDRLHLGHLSLQRAQHPPHLRPGRLRLDPHPLGDPTDELVGAKGWQVGELACSAACSSWGSRAPSRTSSSWCIRSASITIVAQVTRSAVARSRAAAACTCCSNSACSIRHTTLRLDGLRTARLPGIQMDKPARLRTP